MSNICGLSVIFIKLCTEYNLLTKILEIEDILVFKSKFKNIDTKTCIKECKELPIFNISKTKILQNITNLLDNSSSEERYIFYYFIKFIKELEKDFIINKNYSSHFFLEKLINYNEFIFIYSYAQGIGGDESRYFINDFINMIKYLLTDLISSKSIQEIKWKDKEVEEILNKDNTKIFKINIDNISKNVMNFIYLVTIISFINVIRVQREPVNAKVIHTSTIIFISMILSIDTNISNFVKDLSDKKYYQVDAFKASGAGGQHVNKTNSAVRITHKLLNIVVTSQSERSFIANKNFAENVMIEKIKNAFIYTLTTILKNSVGTINTDRNAKDITFNYKRNVFTFNKTFKYSFSINILENKKYHIQLLKNILNIS